MRALLIAATAGLVVSLLAGCGGTPIAPTQEAQLTVTVNTPSTITIEVAGQAKGNIDITHLSLIVPTHTDVVVDVRSMDGLHASTQTLQLTGDFTLTINF